MFTGPHIQNLLTGAGSRKGEGLRPVHLLFVLTNLAFLRIRTVYDLPHQPLQSLFQAPKDPFDLLIFYQ